MGKLVVGFTHRTDDDQNHQALPDNLQKDVQLVVLSNVYHDPSDVHPRVGLIPTGS